MGIISLKTSKTFFNNLHKTSSSSSMSQQIFTFSNDSLVTGDEIPVYQNQNQNAGMLSEMFNFRHQNNNPIIPVINLTDSAAAAATTTVDHQNSTLHMLLPNHQFTSQGLSLSLSSTLEAAATAAAAKSEDFRSFYSNQNRFISQDFNYFNTHYHQFNQFKTQFRSFPAAAIATATAASSSSSFNLLRNSRYAIAAQELLEEFCSVGRGYFKKSKLVNGGGGGVCGGGDGGGVVKDDENGSDSLSASDRIEHQRRKVKLLAMLEEVDRRYNNYCEQMQMIVNSFDTVMGHNAALPYTTLAQKAMSRHFRCLKDAIAVQLKRSCERLGDKNATAISSSKLTKGETPRLRLLEQNLRQQRAFHQMGMMEQETWRPQRGLPERSVNLLRAWLFEHFLHPYPSDADKHLLARQTGLSRNQVSNWFINARVRLWKPMVEEMYQQESKEIEEENQENEENEEEINNKDNKSSKSNNIENNFTIARTTSQTPTQSLNANANANAGVVGHHKRLRSNNINNVYENDSSSLLLPSTAAFSVVATCQESIGGFDSVVADGDDDVIRFGTNQSGDVSLTLGLRHAGNVSDRDFGGF